MERVTFRNMRAGDEGENRAKNSPAFYGVSKAAIQERLVLTDISDKGKG